MTELLIRRVVVVPVVAIIILVRVVVWVVRS